MSSRRIAVTQITAKLNNFQFADDARFDETRFARPISSRATFEAEEKFKHSKNLRFSTSLTDTFIQQFSDQVSQVRRQQHPRKREAHGGVRLRNSLQPSQRIFLLEDIKIWVWTKPLFQGEHLQ